MVHSPTHTINGRYSKTTNRTLLHSISPIANILSGLCIPTILSHADSRTLSIRLRGAAFKFTATVSSLSLSTHSSYTSLLLQTALRTLKIARKLSDNNVEC